MGIESEDVDPSFLRALTEAAGVEPGEFAFERRGSGDTTYPLHGVILGVDAHAGVITLRRTRTHAGEVHEMGLRYFLTAISPRGEKFINHGLVERNLRFRAKQLARENAVSLALSSPLARKDLRPVRSTFLETVTVRIDGHTLQGFLYRDLEHPTQKVLIAADSLIAAQQFIGMQDIFMPLDDLLWDAINGTILWPAWIQCERRADPEAWSADWVEIYKVLRGLSPSSLTAYLNTLRTGYEFPKLNKLTPAERSTWLDRGLLRYETLPSTAREILNAIGTVAELRKLMKIHGLTPEGTTRAHLTEQLLAHETPALLEAAKGLLRPPRARVFAPCGLSRQEFLTALSELRMSFFQMRQWLRAESDRFRDSESEFLRAAA